MYDQYPMHDVPQNNFIQRFFSQRWSAIALEIVMTIVITIAAGAAFDFFDPLDGSQATSANSGQAAAGLVEIGEFRTRNPLAFIKKRGQAYIQERRFAAAEAMFDWAIALAPDDADSYSWRGYANMLAGDYLEAQADYRKVFENERNSFDANSALCWAYGETGEFARAKRHCQRSLDTAFNRSEFAIALENWCWLQVEMGDYEQAAEESAAFRCSMRRNMKKCMRWRITIWVVSMWRRGRCSKRCRILMRHCGSDRLIRRCIWRLARYTIH